MHLKQRWCFFLILSLFLSAPGVFAENYALEDCLQPGEDVRGQRGSVLNIQAVDYFLDRIAAFANEPLTEFDADAQHEAMAEDLQAVLGMLDLVLQDHPDQKALLWRYGFGWSLAYNLGVPESAAQTDAAFRKLLAIDPDHLKGNYFYGVHLTHVPGREAEGMRFLHQAADAGLPEALYALGYAHLRGGQSELARTFFTRYAEYYPENPEIQELLRTLPEKTEQRPLLPGSAAEATKIPMH